MSGRYANNYPPPFPLLPSPHPAETFDVQGAVTAFAYDQNEPEVPYTLRISTPTNPHGLVIGFRSHELAYEWDRAIKDSATQASQLRVEREKRERSCRVAKEMADITVYFRSVPFKTTGWVFNEMSSFSETRGEKAFVQQFAVNGVARYHINQVSRVYPKGQRVDSSNFNPMPFWSVGCQMCALNYQTGDRWTQCNDAKFRDNGRSGYVLKPKFMLHERYDPTQYDSTIDLVYKHLQIRIICARHLCKSGRSVSSPFVLTEIIGSPFDSGVKHKTRAVGESLFKKLS